MYDYSKHMLTFGVISLAILLSYRYNGNLSDKNSDKIKSIQKYLVDDDKKNSPILWIYIPNDKEYPYISLCLKSIISKCGTDFNIVTIDDNSLSTIIPDWTINMTVIPDPMKTNVRNLAVTRLLYLYGGLFIPPSFICNQTLIDIYDDSVKDNKILVGEVSNKNIMSSYTDFSPSLSIIGCEKNNKCISDITHKLEILISQDYTNESVFTGYIQKELMEWSNTGCMRIIDANMIGIEDADGYMVTIDRLFGNTYIPFQKNIYGIYLPNEDILNRTKYKWFKKMTIDEILNSNLIIGELFRNN